jgi:hypothetical protein
MKSEALLSARNRFQSAPPGAALHMKKKQYGRGREIGKGVSERFVKKLHI